MAETFGSVGEGRQAIGQPRILAERKPLAVKTAIQEQWWGAMTLLEKSQTGLDYRPCRYGTSRTLFRGPAKSLEGRYISVLGGTETYGRFVEEPFPELLQGRLGRTTVNFGCMNAGLDVFINDPVVMRACMHSALTIVQIVGAQNMSNRFYTVHPRRNDRFLRPSRRMMEIWPDVDFTEIHFTRHLLKTLRTASPDRFEMLRKELSEAWIARMKSLVRDIGGRVVLLWMSDLTPERDLDLANDGGPLFVTREMLDALRSEVLDIVEVVSPRRYGSAETEGMVFPELERPVAENLPGPGMHGRTAEALALRLSNLL